MSNEQAADAPTKSLSAMKLAELQALASSRGLKGISKMRKSQLVEALSGAASAPSAPAQAPADQAPADQAPSQVTRDKDVKEETASSTPRKTRRRRVATTEAIDPAQVQLDLPTPQSDKANETASDVSPKQTPDSLDSIELPEGDDADGRGRNRRDRNRRSRRDRNTNRRERNGNRADGQNQATRTDRDDQVREDEQLAPIAGILDVQDNHAFVRTSGYLPGPKDVYVTLGNVRRWGLRAGDAVAGAVRQPREGERQRQKYNALVRVDSVNGMTIEEAQARREFGKLTPLYPNEQLRLETSAKAFTPRVIDLVAPIGKGQRGLIVSPPKAGKTMVIQQIAKAIEVNNPEVHLMVVLVDERPEEVTDMRSIVKGEVIASTFDRPASDHTIVAELAIERAKRLVELGQDVVVLLDSLTRLSRAYNLAAPASGRILSGGVDASALYPPKKFFGGARNLKEGGSLTIIASALVETGSKMDEVIFEEFKGTGNMELRLSRQLADRRIFPAIDVNASGTRREEMLFKPEELRIMWKLRRVLGTLDQQSSLELVLDKLKETQSNAEFLMLVQKTTPSAD
ncbi:transcription termination factor Rho [Schaalia vaccimaxillae]|uniref:transcription termination factor Rho n=1 Tax=Schaalia vaccimaxillae TaxID=183916 RepID=UPI0003B38CB6|nr:transcription termination factor Rho [Schaalia vaccimaxillae]